MYSYSVSSGNIQHPRPGGRTGAEWGDEGLGAGREVPQKVQEGGDWTTWIGFRLHTDGGEARSTTVAQGKMEGQENRGLGGLHDPV